MVPIAVFKSDEPVMLDGMRLEELQQSLGLPLRLTGH